MSENNAKRKHQGQDRNEVCLRGNLTADPILRQTSGGTSVCNMRIAVRSYNGESNFFDIAVFGKNAENCNKYLSKGRALEVIGELRNEKYENKDGVTIYRTKVVGNRVTFFGRKPATQSTSTQEEVGVF